MRFWRPAAAFAALAIVLPTTAAAEVGFGPRFTLVRGNVDAQTSADRYTGGIMRAHLSPRTALELSLDWRTVVNDSLTERTRDLPFQASLLVFPVRARLAPYLLGGVGWYSQRVEALADADTVLSSTTTRTFGYHAGLGGEIRLGRHLGMHLDYRYKFIRLSEEEAAARDAEPSDGFRVPIVSSLGDKLRLSQQGSMWTGGLTLYF